MKLKELIRKAYGVTSYSISIDDEERFVGKRSELHLPDWKSYSVVDFTIQRGRLIVNLEEEGD